MVDKIGIVTKILAKRLEARDSFDDLIVKFINNGFKNIEIRDEISLRESNFGRVITKIEKVMEKYSNDMWKQICYSLYHQNSTYNHNEKFYPNIQVIKPDDRPLFNYLKTFINKTRKINLSYAISHPWLMKFYDNETDNNRICKAKKLAFLLSPYNARLRLVDLESESAVKPEVAIGNLKRYNKLLPNYKITLAVENALYSAIVLYQMARQGGSFFVYDEANIYQLDGTSLNASEEFLNSIKIEYLISVHLKQKTKDGISTQLGIGFVDLKTIITRLKKLSYRGDLLIENAPSDNPLEDAIRSREYLIKFL